MKVAVTGATGLVGHWIARHLNSQGHDMVALGRRETGIEGVEHVPYELSDAPPQLDGFDALVHAAFSHVPGRYRGGEGDDPEGFMQRNLDGTLRLFEAAQGLDRIVFLSSRAVYGAYPAGTVLEETRPPRPDTLYGRVKRDAESALARLHGPAGISLRVTGVYGAAAPGRAHKWCDLFDSFASGAPIAPRCASEVHAGDLARAVDFVLRASRNALEDGILNVSDFVLDRRDLLRTYAKISGVTGILPPRAEADLVNVMTTRRLRDLGWRPGGQAALAGNLAAMIAAQA